MLTTAPSTRALARERQARRYELDWCRAFVVLAVIPVHTAGLFTAAADQVLGTQNASPVSLSLLTSLGVWGIALFFLIAGAGAYFALERRSPRQFIAERCLRLFIPFAFASLTLVPLQDYLTLRTFPGALGQVAMLGWDRHVADSLVSFYPRYLGGYVTFLAHYTPQQEIVFWNYLWFLPRLLSISLLGLPLLLVLRSVRGKRLIACFAVLCERHCAVVFLLALPLGIMLTVLGWQWQTWGTTDTFNVLAQFVFYGLVFVYGYMLYAAERLRRAVQRDSLLALVLGVLVFVPTQLPGVGNQALAHDYSAGGMLAAFLRALAAWLGVLGMVGLAMRFLPFTNRLGRYLTEATYPLYLLQLPVLYLLLFALPFLTGQAYPLLRYLAMVTLTFATTLAIYELLIRHIPPMRALFGMRPSPTSSPDVSQEPLRAKERRAEGGTKGERRESGKRT